MYQLSLNGEWQLREKDSEELHAARIPGSVYSSLLADGSMPDPYWRENEYIAYDLMKKDWLFARTFEVPEKLLEMSRVILRCEGLDTLAQININGQRIGNADNMHITWEWDVKQYLRTGKNEVEILFGSPVLPALAYAEKHPAWCSTDAIPGYPSIRKAHCMYGWDWGARLPDAGIWRDIMLLGIDACRILSTEILQEHEEKLVRLRIRPELEGNGEWTAAVTAPGGTVYPADADGVVEITDPELWWPGHLGAQPLYSVEVTLTANGTVQDVWTGRIGLRTITFSRRPDTWGEEFCTMVNGVRIFAMGGDYIPEDNILQRVTPERTRRLLEDAKLAGYNTIRVWGGGYYPSDDFYDICDELGLMVWQDLMYACAMYDLTPAFEQSIRTETEQNVRRIRHHASLAILCGNNEMESFIGEAERALVNHQPGFDPKRRSHIADYIKMFEYILPEICRRLAPQTFWWPSSPSSGGNFDEPGSPDRGDVHYWDVWHGEKPITEYRKFMFRYVSEFGFQSFPCLKTVEQFTLPEDRNIFSRIMERHQRNGAANGKIMAYLAQTFRYPGNFDDLLYASQLLQAEAMRYGVEHWRRNRGRCMGAIIWQLNDIWPVASWASIDYYGRWKAMHYSAKRFFAPVMISCEERGELDQNPRINEYRSEPVERSIRLNVTNETLREQAGIVHWALRTPEGHAVISGAEKVCVPPMSSLWLEKRAFPEASVTGHYVSYRFEQDGRVVSSGSAIFCAPKHFEFTDPCLEARPEGDEIVVTAKAYARQVWIESEDADLLLEDNAFDMDPGERRIRVLRGSAKRLRVRSVWNLGRE